MRKAIEVAAVGAVLLATSPPAHAEPTDFSGQMVVIPVRNGQVSGAGTGVYSVHLHVVDPGFSIMTASNGCTQEWHGMDMQVDNGFARQATLPGGVVRAFLWSHTTSTEGPDCRSSKKLGLTGKPQNGRAHVDVNDQEIPDASWVLDSDN
jgi:hypothetical protein